MYQLENYYGLHCLENCSLCSRYQIFKLLYHLTSALTELCAPFHRCFSYRLDILVADEALVELGADELELPVEVVGRLLVGVDDLAQHLLVVVQPVRAPHLGSVLAARCRYVQGGEQGLRQLHTLVVGVQGREDAA